MDVTTVCERVRGIARATSMPSAVCASEVLSAGLRAVTEVRSWLDSQQAALTARLAVAVPFPEQTVAECTRTSLRAAERVTERAASLDRLPNLSAALAAAAVTAGHIDAVTSGARRLDADQRAELFERADELADIAAAASVPEFRRRVAALVRSVDRTDGMERLERQRRATELRAWTDADGMWCLAGRFDPLTGVRLSARLEAAVKALFAETTPDTAPSDPVLRQRHLQALALARLLTGEGGLVAPVGRPEFVVVVHVAADPEAGADAVATDGPVVDWGIPVEIPARVLADLAGDADVRGVVVRNGVVLHAPGSLDLGRTTRLANRAQRRALDVSATNLSHLDNRRRPRPSTPGGPTTPAAARRWSAPAARPERHEGRPFDSSTAEADPYGAAMGRLDGKVAIITGGARGQGLAEAKRFVAEGATVVITDVRVDEGERAAADAGATFRRHDVTSSADWAAVVESTLADHGRIDVLVNNAGIFEGAGLADTDEERYRRIIDINQVGVFLGLKAVVPTMLEQAAGSIINISSVAGLRSAAGAFAYAASKFAVTGMTKSLAVEVARTGVRVNSIHPGLIETPMMDDVRGDRPDRLEAMARRVPMGRVAEADEVATLAVFLASDESSYVTGAGFVVDGGMTA